MPTPKLDTFTEAYVTCALWSSNENRDPDGDAGLPLDQNFGIADIVPETLAAMIADCEKFQEEHWDDICTCLKAGRDSIAEAGHDFWLTRNGHGSGFWDGDWPEAEAERLTEASKEFGEFSLYVGDDEKIYEM